MVAQVNAPLNIVSMLIKYQALASNLKNKLHAVYVLIGQEHYLLNDAVYSIKKAWKQQGDSDDKTLHLNTSTDWAMLLEEANSYSLFSELVLLDARFDKKTIDSAGKGVLTQYIEHINTRCLIVLRAPNLQARQLQWLSNHQQVLIVQAAPLTAAALKSWIISQLQTRSIRHEPEVPALIHQYAEGNMLACAQVIERLALISSPQLTLSTSDVMDQLIDQCDYQLYELADACLAANSEKAIHLLRQACLNRTEPTLILWLFTQEIRLLIQLSHKLKQLVAFNTACSQLKIWPQRAKLYQMSLARMPLARLYQLLHRSKELDEKIKSSQNHHIWDLFEQLVLEMGKK